MTQLIRKWYFCYFTGQVVIWKVLTVILGSVLGIVVIIGLTIWKCQKKKEGPPPNGQEPPVDSAAGHHRYYEIPSLSRGFQPDSVANDETRYEEPLPNLHPHVYSEVIPEPPQRNNSHDSTRQPTNHENNTSAVYTPEYTGNSDDRAYIALEQRQAHGDVRVDSFVDSD